MKKALFITGGILSIAVAGVLASSVFAATRDCTINAIAKCGVHTKEELKQKYVANQTGDLDDIYSHYGISHADITSSGIVKEGRTYKDGTVIVDGETVATNAASLGRVKKNGDYAVKIGDKTYWEARNQDVFRSGSLEVLVFFKADGTFKAAVIKDCGNPVKATPVSKPKPQPPKPTTTPVYTCDTLKLHQINRNTYRFAGGATAKDGASITAYYYDFGDGKSIKTDKAVVTHQYARAGKYAATVTVEVSVNGKTKTTTSAACAVKVKVDEEPQKPVEEKPAEKPVEEVENCPVSGKESLPKASEECEETVPQVLPATGVGSLLSGVMGLSSLTAASYYYIRSRRIV